MMECNLDLILRRYSERVAAVVNRPEHHLRTKYVVDNLSKT